MAGNDTLPTGKRENMKKGQELRKNILITAGILGIAALIAFFLQQFVSTDTHVPLLFVLAVLFVSRYTEGYVYGIAASVMAVIGKYAGKVLTYDFIIKEIWGPNMRTDNRILRVNMANIRRKIEKNPAQPEYLFTEVGVGYRIVDPD